MKTTAIARTLGWHAWNMIRRRHDETLMRPAAVQEIAELIFQRRQDLLCELKTLEEAERELADLDAFNQV